MGYKIKQDKHLRTHCLAGKRDTVKCFYNKTGFWDDEFYFDSKQSVH